MSQSNFHKAMELAGPIPNLDHPLRLRKGMAAKLLVLPRFFKLSIEDCIIRARKLTKNRVPVRDKATAIALILGAEGKNL